MVEQVSVVVIGPVGAVELRGALRIHLRVRETAADAEQGLLVTHTQVGMHVLGEAGRCGQGNLRLDRHRRTQTGGRVAAVTQTTSGLQNFRRCGRTEEAHPVAGRRTHKAVALPEIGATCAVRTAGRGHRVRVGEYWVGCTAPVGGLHGKIHHRDDRRRQGGAAAIGFGRNPSVVGEELLARGADPSGVEVAVEELGVFARAVVEVGGRGGLVDDIPRPAGEALTNAEVARREHFKAEGVIVVPA